MAMTPYRPADGFYLKDDFVTNDAVGDATVGELDWEIVAIGNASTLAYLVTTNTVPGRPGILRITTAVTADGDGEVVRLDEDNIVLGGGGGSFSFAFRYPDITGNALAGNDVRFGLQDSVTATEPTVGIWSFFDAGVGSLQADSADHGDESAAFAQPAGQQSLTTGTTAVLGTWHTGEVRFFGTNAQGGPASAIQFIDGVKTAALNGTIDIDNDEEMEFSFVHYQNSGGADSLEMDIDYIDLWLPRGA